MRVTKWGECGILCSMYLAQRYGEGAVGAPDIASSQGLDVQYVQQILQRLRKGNVIDSVRGPRGGYQLTRPPEEISLKDILYAAEGDTFEIICEHSPIRPETGAPSHCSDRETCNLHSVWQELKSAINTLLDERKLSELIKPSQADELVQLSKR